MDNFTPGNFTPGWNDPPKNVGAPTGNLKINLNKRIAFPLGSAPPQQQGQGSAPLLLPPKPPTAVIAPISPNLESSEKNSDEVSSQKENVLKVLEAGIQELSGSVKTSAANKLKTLETDWNQCDIEIQKLLVELSKHLEEKDAKSAANVQRKIVMKGCNKQWVLAIRQIVMNLETVQAQGNDKIEVPLTTTPLPLPKVSAILEASPLSENNAVNNPTSNEDPASKIEWI